MKRNCGSHIGMLAHAVFWMPYEIWLASTRGHYSELQNVVFGESRSLDIKKKKTPGLFPGYQTKRTPKCGFYLFLEGTLVESELVTLQNVTVNTSGLAWARRDAGQQTTGSELGLKGRVDLGTGLAGGDLALDRLGLGHSLGSGGGVLGLLSTSLTEGETVVGLVPLAERSGIDLDDGGLGQGVGAYQTISILQSSNTGSGSKTYGRARCWRGGKSRQ